MNPMTSDPEKIDLSRLRIQRDDRQIDRTTAPGVNWRLWGSVLAVVVLIAIVLGVSSQFAGTAEVELSTVTLTFPSQANAVLTASGYIVAQTKAAVASKGTGRLAYLGVEEGDHVVKDQIIARLEDADVVAALERARANLGVAKADEFDASQSFERAKRLFSSNLISKSELDPAQARFDRVHASILSAAAAVREAEVALEYTRIRAPFDGTVLTKNADVGEVVAPFGAAANSRGTVVSMADMRSLQVEADVSEANITRVSAGQPCDIVLDAYPAQRYHGHVHKIVPTADRSKATVLTKVAFDDKDDRVLPEMSAKVTFLAADAGTHEKDDAVLSVLTSTLVQRNGKTAVFRVADGKAVEIQIQTGKEFGNRTVIVQGLSQGDQVVLTPDPKLASGTVVKQRTH